MNRPRIQRAMPTMGNPGLAPEGALGYPDVWQGCGHVAQSWVGPRYSRYPPARPAALREAVAASSPYRWGGRSGRSPSRSRLSSRRPLKLWRRPSPTQRASRRLGWRTAGLGASGVRHIFSARLCRRVKYEKVSLNDQRPPGNPRRASPLTLSNTWRPHQALPARRQSGTTIGRSVVVTTGPTLKQARRKREESAKEGECDDEGADRSRAVRE